MGSIESGFSVWWWFTKMWESEFYDKREDWYQLTEISEVFLKRKFKNLENICAEWEK